MHAWFKTFIGIYIAYYTTVNTFTVQCIEQHTYSHNLTGKVEVFIVEIRAVQVLDIKKVFKQFYK